MGISMSIPGFIEMGITALTQQWFPKHDDNGGDYVEEYKASQMGKYFWVNFAICVLGVLINLLPVVKNWLERLREDAIAATALSESTSGGDDDDIERCSTDDEADAMELEPVTVSGPFVVDDDEDDGNFATVNLSEK